MKWQKFFFDKQDYELLAFVNKFALMQGKKHANFEILDSNLHPHGIKTLALSREMRVANAVIRFLDKLDVGKSEERLIALQALYDDVLNSAKTDYRRNTARILVEIMKDIVRNHGKVQHQLQLAHSFRRAAQGNPYVVRFFLDYYGLVEMPEKWNQLVFDHNIHDLHSHGSKNPTHLIMDAWLQGIRYLTIVYYNYVEEDVAFEILKAAEIVGIQARIGIEFSVPFNDKFIQFVWSPRYAAHSDIFLQFLQDPPMQRLLQMGRQSSAWRQSYTFDLVNVWNTKHKFTLAQDFAFEDNIPLVSLDAFKSFVGNGHATAEHLCEFIYDQLSATFDAHVKVINEKEDNDLCIFKSLSVELLYEKYLCPAQNTELLLLRQEEDEQAKPPLLSYSPVLLLDWLTTLRPNFLITLNVAGLSVEDFLEILWQCNGMITHIELYNQRKWHNGKLLNFQDLCTLRNSINSASIPKLKYNILSILRKREQYGPYENENEELHKKHCELLREILRNIPTLKNFYSIRPLRTRMGTSSTGRKGSEYHMGIAFLDTLPPRAVKALQNNNAGQNIPFHIDLQQQVNYSPSPHMKKNSFFARLSNIIPCFKHLAYQKKSQWLSQSSTASYNANGNLALLGAVRKNRLRHYERSVNAKYTSTHFLNTTVANILKVLAGFIPAALAFQYTQSWWFLAWFGPIIWFAITGCRNIFQAVIAGRGFNPSSLLRWNDYVNWSRLCDSLLYTGFSVPILELGVRTLLLQDALGISVATHTVLVYTVMSAVNGCYIAWHNIVRGLPKEAVIGNLFRSALSIPMAIFLNGVILYFLRQVLGVADPQSIMTMSSAIISKLSSDIVAAIIEGYADHKNNVRIRSWDYKTKIQQMFQVYVSLELLYPEEDVFMLIAKPKVVLKRLEHAHPHLYKAYIITALDFMYFWFYRPRAHEVCKRFLNNLSAEERLIFMRMQLVLTCEHKISKALVSGLVGKNFGRALSFYLDKNNSYFKQIKKIIALDTKKINDAKQ